MLAKQENGKKKEKESEEEKEIWKNRTFSSYFCVIRKLNQTLFESFSRYDAFSLECTLHFYDEKVWRQAKEKDVYETNERKCRKDVMKRCK